MRHVRRVFAPAIGLTAALLALGSLAITPAGAHIGTVKHALAKHFEAKNTTIEFGQLRMNVDSAPVVVATVAPFTLTAVCDQPEGPGTGIRGRVLITTSEGSSILNASDDEEIFGPEDNANPEDWTHQGGFAPGGTPAIERSDSNSAMAPSGTAILGTTTLATNFAGFHCVFSGFIQRTAS